MSTILAIDTSSPVCSVALAVAGKVVTRQTPAERQAAQKLLPLVEALLSDQLLTLASVDAIAVVTGPGSFTGMRIGVGVAQGLSFAADCPVIGISALALTAVSGQRALPSSNQHWLVAEPARDGEVYFAAYHVAAAGQADLLGKEQVAIPENLQIQTSDSLWNSAGAAWDEDLASRLGITLASHYEALSADLIALCDIARHRLESGQYQTDGGVLPNYIKDQLDYS